MRKLIYILLLMSIPILSQNRYSKLFKEADNKFDSLITNLYIASHRSALKADSICRPELNRIMYNQYDKEVDSICKILELKSEFIRLYLNNLDYGRFK